MEKQEHRIWAVVQEDGRGFDLDIASVTVPRTFPSLRLADEYVELCYRHPKWSSIRLLVVPATLII